MVQTAHRSINGHHHIVGIMKPYISGIQVQVHGMDRLIKGSDDRCALKPPAAQHMSHQRAQTVSGGPVCADTKEHDSILSLGRHLLPYKPVQMHGKTLCLKTF